MLFPDLSPSREECIAAMSDALQSDGGLIYLDASVLIHCYEMSALASDDLLRTLEQYEERVGVPVWAARETWDYLTTRTTKKPLMGLADRIQKDLARFQTETTRYIDDVAGGITREDYQRDLTDAVETVVVLIRQVAHHEPKIDQTSEKLLPFIEARRLASDLASILAEVSATAASRMKHRVPPGFGDAPQGVADDIEDSPQAQKPKGKTANPHGDLIIWLEILADCARKEAEHLVIVTRDTGKGDWAYAPRKVRDDKGRPQENRSGVTLPHPLLIHEARQRVPTLQTMHVVSVDMLANIWTAQRFDIGNLAAALQAEEEVASNDTASAEPSLPPAEDDAGSYVAEFGSADMAYEPDPENEHDQLITDLSVEDWKVQNQTVRRLEPQLAALTRVQRLQVGRGLVFAANNGALEPAELLERVLGSTALARSLKSDILIGALAEVFLAETGEPKKPVATRGVTASLYRHDPAVDLGEAYDIVLGRLRALRREYLALPREEPEAIRLQIAHQKGRLINVSTEHAALLEEDAPPARALQRMGRESSMTVAEIIEFIAEEFVLPLDRLTADLSQNATLIVPERTGFVAWGPRSGIQLR